MNVIENCDDVVVEGTMGFYWREGDNGVVQIDFLLEGERFNPAWRYIRQEKPTFPPRRPPKPEIEWRWVSSAGNEQWAYEARCGVWVNTNGSVLYPVTVLE